jgi:uncharacterized repeat protein (TIGR01451 family)
MVSKPMQGISLDLGTTVLPFTNLRVSTVVDKEFVSPGESLIYTIRIFNHGQSAIRTMQIRLFDALDPWVDYVPGTTTAAVVDSGTVKNITDDNIGTIFPLDETGLFIPLVLPRRGGMIDVSFEVKLKPAFVIMMKAESIINNGTMQEPSGPLVPFDAKSNVIYNPIPTGTGCSSDNPVIGQPAPLSMPTSTTPSPMTSPSSPTAITKDATSQPSQSESAMNPSPPTLMFPTKSNVTLVPVASADGSISKPWNQIGFVQTFYIPFPEASMYNDFFLPINTAKVSGANTVESIIAVAVSTDKTVIWYDHWEDGFDVDATNATITSKTTEVWGDGKASNGCRPNITCTDATDILNAGTSFVIQNNVPIPRDRAVLRWDGGDKVLTSFPIAITRGGYPSKPGSLLAGAVEVLDTSLWGTSFICPVGGVPHNLTVAGNAVRLTNIKLSFEFTSFLFMAKEQNTTVRLPNNSSVILNEGESRLIRVNRSDTITANKPIQVDLITGDIDSEYESRWYSLLDVDSWGKEYVNPTGESWGRTKVILYNPGTTTIRITMDSLINGTTRTSLGWNLPAKAMGLSPIVPDNSGAIVKSTSNFIALTITDSEVTSGFNESTGGQWYDWGFSLQPLADLTPQVLVAWGYV